MGTLIPEDYYNYSTAGSWDDDYDREIDEILDEQDRERGHEGPDDNLLEDGQDEDWDR